MQMFDVTAHWDPEAMVWWAESAHIPGLATEARTLEQLEGNVLDIAPELLRLNLGFEGDFGVNLVRESV
jgi:predicted RNase H-like HicB family nuclease